MDEFKAVSQGFSDACQWPNQQKIVFIQLCHVCYSQCTSFNHSLTPQEREKGVDGVSSVYLIAWRSSPPPHPVRESGLHSDINASRGVIPICSKATINLPISEPCRRNPCKATEPWKTLSEGLCFFWVFLRRRISIDAHWWHIAGFCSRSGRTPWSWALSMQLAECDIRVVIMVAGVLMSEWPSCSRPPCPLLQSDYNLCIIKRPMMVTSCLLSKHTF